MTVILPSASGANAAADDTHTEVIIHVHARIVASARVCRKVNGWLSLEVGDRMLAGEPELIAGDPLIWRVPIQWTSPTQGVLAESIAQVLVDAVTGEILASSPTAQEIQQRVAALAHTLRSATP